MNILAITRLELFSPGTSAAADAAIITAVAIALRERGHGVDMVSESDFITRSYEPWPYDAVVSMGRLDATISRLEQLPTACQVVNSAQAMRCSSRAAIDHIQREHGISAPPLHGAAGYWLKRGDATATEKGDVVFCRNEDELRQQQQDFRKRGITDQVVQAHVAGDLVKFYAVSHTPFFRFFYPTDDGISKFGDEQRNGTARHYAFQTGALEREARRLASLTGLEVFGGDAVVRADGSFAIIDFNDFPSFSRCRQDAAAAIADIITNYPNTHNIH